MDQKGIVKRYGFSYPIRTVLLVLALFFGMISMQAAPITVSGKVTSASDGEPLIGASVTVKGQSTGVATNVEGAFTIKAEVGSTIVFSSVGYKPLEAKVTGPTLNVELQDNIADLNEVVVVGYGVQKKKLVTGATAQVKGEDIARLNTSNPLQAMQGQLPGVQITSTSGQPGEGLKVNIRGLGTINNSSPIYLIDGVPGDISSLNPNDIESIDVLKDAASAAIYGAQAANGVVLVTTRQGTEGRAVVTFDGYYGWQKVARKAHMLNAADYMTIMDEQAINEGNAPFNWSGMNSIWNRNADGEIISPVNTDWVNSMFKDDAPTQSYNLGVSGGSATTNYSISLGYFNQEGVVGGGPISNYSRYNFRVNSEHKLFKNILTVGEQVSFVYSKKNGIGVGNQYNNGLRSSFMASPLNPIYDADGNFYCTDNSDWYIYDGNPYAQMLVTTNNINKGGTFFGNAYAQLEPIKNLKIRTVLATIYGSSESRSFTPIYRFSPYNYSDHTSVSQGSSQNIQLTWTNTVSYDWRMGQNAFNALLGMEAYRIEGSSLYGAQAYLKEGFDTWPYAWISNDTAASTDDGLSAGGSPWDKDRRVSYFGRLGWNFDEKYMVYFTLRADGFSKFARGHRFGYFPSVSAGWNISNEKFMESTRSWLDYLKIRASWGRVGNQNISNYQYVAPIKNSNTHYYFGEYIGAGGLYNDYSSLLSNNWGAYPNRLVNPNVTWETSEQTNIGFDAYILNSRLGVNFDYYIKKTKDWLVEAPILATAGTAAPFINGGNVTNKGVELNLTWNDNIGDFRYSIGANGAVNHNEVGRIPNKDGIIHGGSNQFINNSSEFYRAHNDHAIGYFWGLKSAGIFQNQEQIDQWIASGNGVLQANPKPGDAKFVDVNHDGRIDDNDKVDLGVGIPKFTFGFNIGLYYKHADLGVTASGATGFKIAQGYRNMDSKTANYTTAILKRWTGEGTSDFLPRVTEQNYNYTQFSDLFLQDGDYLRISNITLGYDFSGLINQKWCSKARLYVQVQNAFTFTKYDGMDPEVGFGPEGWVSGVDIGYYPRPRTYLVGVNLSF